MTLPFSFPDWVPWWLGLLVVAAAILLGLAFVLMPFSVFGVKSRLDAIELRLDEVQGEIRSLVLRLPEPLRGTLDDDDYAPRARYAAPRGGARPPIPPAPDQRAGLGRDGVAREGLGREGQGRTELQGRAELRNRRAEPRLDWPQ